MIPKNVIACQIVYGSFTVRCSIYRTREENLAGAWKLLTELLKKNNSEIPDSKESFLEGEGQVTYYRSY